MFFTSLVLVVVHKTLLEQVGRQLQPGAHVVAGLWVPLCCQVHR